MTHLSHFQILTRFLTIFSIKFNLLMLFQDNESNQGASSNSGQSFSMCPWNLNSISTHDYSPFKGVQSNTGL